MTASRAAPLLRVEAARTWGVRHWLGLSCSVGIAAINLYVWTLTGLPQFLAIAGSFAFGVGLFATRFWNPALYLVAVAHLLALGVVWLLDGLTHPTLGLLNGALSVALLLCAASLLLTERGPADE